MATREQRGPDCDTLLHRLDRDVLEGAVQRLTLAELRRLASFPSQPHTLVHRALAALHCALLSMAPEHTAASVLRITPWPLLRLEVLARSEELWHKMKTRVRRLQQRPVDAHAALSTAQIRFVAQTLVVPLMADDDDASLGRSTAALLARMGRVSLIAEAVAAFVLLCVHLTLSPSSPRRRAGELSPGKRPLLAAVAESPPVNNASLQPLALDKQRKTLSSSSPQAPSIRQGLKVNGRFYLLRFVAVAGANRAGRWRGVLLRPRHRDSVSPASGDAGCAALQALLLPVTQQLVDTASLPPPALRYVLMWDANCQLRRLDPLGLPQRSLVRPPPPSLLLLVVELDVATRAPMLLAVGNVALVEPLVTSLVLSTLREHVEPKLGALFAGRGHVSFSFLHRGAAVSRLEEPSRLVAELLPCATLVVDNSRRPRCLSMLPQLAAIAAALQRRLEASLRSAPQTSAGDDKQSEPVALFAMQQSLGRQHDQETLFLLEMLADWASFVRFQELQRSLSVLDLTAKPQRPKRRQPIDFLGDHGDAGPLRPEMTPEERALLSLPLAPFRPQREYLRPLYATLDVISLTRGLLRSPFGIDGLGELVRPASEDSAVRLVVGDENHVIHVQSAVEEHETTGGFTTVSLALAFARDASCPPASLLTMQRAFVWRIESQRQHQRQRKRHTEKNRAHAVPPQWLRDVQRWVRHPTFDFGSTDHAAAANHFVFFHVAITASAAERLVEHTLWSRDVDWEAARQRTDLEQLITRPLYDALCRSHPRSWSIDSLKFSRLLRDCELQPRALTVGDAAFVFFAHRAPGSFHDMSYDGFLASLQWIARRLYRDNDADQNGTGTGSDDRARLQRLCFEWLIRAGCVQDIWFAVVNAWRLEAKERVLVVVARRWCAATRLQATWRRVLARKQHAEALERRLLERRAAVRMQSVVKMRRVRRHYQHLRAVTIRTQLFIKARRELRRRRAERIAYVERMRVRLVRWMRYRLRVLRVWKTLNARWIARRDRIRAKRRRLICAGAFFFESRLLRASLYHAPPPMDGAQEPLIPSFELELLDPAQSWWRSLPISSAMLHELTDASSSHAVVSGSRKHRKRPQLVALVGRLFVKPLRRALSSSLATAVIQFYRDPIDTSLGRLLFEGAVHVDVPRGSLRSGRVIFRVLLRAHVFTLLAYAATSSLKLRWSVSTAVVYRVLQLARWETLEPLNRDVLREPSVSLEQLGRMRATIIQAFLTAHSGHRLLRPLAEYLLQFGAKMPTTDLLPEVQAERERQRKEQEEAKLSRQLSREAAWSVWAQTRARRFLATRRRRKLALASYTKEFDATCGRLAYVLRREYGVLVFAEKPRSLGALDVPDPPDRYVRLANAGPNGGFVNAFRGRQSRFDESLAAQCLQRWFRQAMWIGVKEWNLRYLARALRFNDSITAPTDLRDPSQVDSLVRFALHLHVLKHEFSQAFAMYEAALAIAPNDVRALVGFAVLLVYSCRYPSKHTWPRALTLLEQARATDPRLVETLQEIEDNCFSWAMFLQPKNANALGNYAVYLQCVRLELDKAETLYRRAIDLDPTNNFVLENYVRLQRERTPEGIYSSAGPGKIAAWRAQQERADFSLLRLNPTKSEA
ncbi:hypothetical protein P43SY_006863 [Pythium insidiosum]|uniref:Uncharacterized protein n=1 Tax=Pythium insidiosum TaxID=114742 RepID=A0AAD5LNV6_PYTIN|nr:hypothetical protein P43SY_006863 [Pythium insidiosum]